MFCIAVCISLFFACHYYYANGDGGDGGGGAPVYNFSGNFDDAKEEVHFTGTAAAVHQSNPLGTSTVMLTENHNLMMPASSSSSLLLIFKVVVWLPTFLPLPF